MELVLPKYFKHRKYTSFQRQLNYFNFKKWTKSKAVVCTFSNDHFVRDRPELAWRITRKKSVPTAGSAAGGRSPTSSHGGRGKARSPSAAARSTSLPAYTPEWKEEDGALRVPHAKRAAATTDFPGFAAARSFPSPTDVDVMFSDHDAVMLPQRYYSPPPMPLAGPSPFHPAPSATTMASFMSASEPESFEWIDTFLPSLDMSGRLVDDHNQQQQQQPSPHAYMGSMMAALMRPTPPHYMFPAANASAVDSYMCLATM